MKNLTYSGEEILETIQMVRTELLDIRTITVGVSLLDCVSNTTEGLCAKIYDKVTGKARDLRKVGLEIEQEYGIPIVNYRVSVTPVSLMQSSRLMPIVMVRMSSSSVRTIWMVSRISSPE